MSEAFKACYEVIRNHSKSFSLASRLLPREVRDRAVAVYAWCRRADDAVDLAGREDQEAALSILRDELEDIYAGRPVRGPALEAFRETVQERGIPKRYPEDLLEGLDMDVMGQRYETKQELLHYCYCVAGSVGLMMCHVMGVKDEAAMRNAAHMGMAMQLTNICRDVDEDWGLGRLYIPDSILARCGFPDLASRLGQPFPESARHSVAQAIEQLLDDADRYYASGDEGLSALSWRCSMAIRTARTVYSSIGARVRGADCDPLAGRAFVPLPRKLALALTSVATSGADLPLRAMRLEVGGTSTPDCLVNFPEDVLPV